jgi:uncharacterized protein (DUF433 family)
MDYAQYGNHYIVADDGIMGGTPCIRGTRMTVYVIEARIKGGDSVEEILGEYPHLTIEQINAALEYAARRSSSIPKGGLGEKRHGEKLPSEIPDR